MGFFGNLWNKTKEVANIIKVAIIDPVIVTVTKLFTESDEMMSGKASGFGGSTDETESVYDYARLITQYIEENKPLYEELENKFIEIYISNFNKFEMENTPLGQMAQKTISGFVKDSSNSLRGLLIGKLIGRVSKDDIECKNILEISNDDKRGKEMNKYLYKVRKEAIDRFTEKTQIEVDNLNKKIEEFLSGELKNIENRAKQSLNEFEKIKNIDGKDLESKQNELIRYGIVISQCNNVLNKCNSYE